MHVPAGEGGHLFFLVGQVSLCHLSEMKSQNKLEVRSWLSLELLVRDKETVFGAKKHVFPVLFFVQN